MPRSVLATLAAIALLLVGAAAFLLRGEDSTSTATRSVVEPPKPPEASPQPKPSAEPPSPFATPPAAAPTNSPPRGAQVHAPKLPMAASGGSITTEPLVVDPQWVPPLRASAESCQEVIARLDAAIAQRGQLLVSERENLVAAANDNLNWFRDFVDTKDAQQVEMLRRAREILDSRLTTLGLQLPADAGKLGVVPDGATP